MVQNNFRQTLLQIPITTLFPPELTHARVHIQKHKTCKSLRFYLRFNICRSCNKKRARKIIETT